MRDRLGPGLFRTRVVLQGQGDLSGRLVAVERIVVLQPLGFIRDWLVTEEWDARRGARHGEGSHPSGRVANVLEVEELDISGQDSARETPSKCSRELRLNCGSFTTEPESRLKSMALFREADPGASVQTVARVVTASRRSMFPLSRATTSRPRQHLR
jgi:hypothetical protein